MSAPTHRRICALLMAAAMIRGMAAYAQADAAIPESALRDPWVRQLAVLQSLADAMASTSGPSRARLDDALTYLQVSLGEFEVQVDQVIDRILADPQFGYVATETSAALATQLGETRARFEAIYAELGVQQREDVRAAQASLAALEKRLEAKVHFERDVLRALGSGSRHQIVELATRWWNGEERAIAVRKLVAELRAAASTGPR